MAKNVNLLVKNSFIVCVVAIVLPFVTHNAFSNVAIAKRFVTYAEVLCGY